MNRAPRALLGLIGSIGAIGASAGIIYGVARMVVNERDPEELAVTQSIATETATAPGPSVVPTTSTSATPASAQLENSILRVSGRNRLEVCLQFLTTNGSPAIASDSARDQVKQAVVDLKDHQYADQAGILNLPPPVVDDGCPTPPLLFDQDFKPNLVEQATGVRPGGARLVTTPSEYTIMLFVLPNGSPQLGGAQSRRIGEEMLCFADDCSEVTVGMCVITSLLDDQSELRQAFERAVGLDREN